MKKANNFDVKRLQSILEERGIKIKILHFEQFDDCGDDAVWLVYTTDLNYVPEVPFNDRNYLTEEEIDVLIYYDGEWDYQAEVDWIESQVRG